MESTNHIVPATEKSDKEAAFFDKQSGAFFRRVDWAAFWTVFIISFSLYLYSLAPSVTLEDSGELAVAADHMGVAHPPGYPLWTLSAWLFQRVFDGITYHGYPNPAWAIGLMSAVYAALACAMLALLVSRSGTDMLRGMKRATAALGLEVETKIAWTAGVASGLLMAFSPVLWSQAVIIEVYALNCFFMILLLLMAYRWMSRPQDNWVLYVTAYLFGLGLTNHHTLFFLAPAFVVAIGFRDRPLFRDGLALFCIALAGYLLYLGIASRQEDAGTDVRMLLLSAFVFLLPVAQYCWTRVLFSEWKRILIGLGAVALGLSFYLYMPVASEQNPPHNWGYTRTWAGFLRSFTRGQYERVSPSDILGNPLYFMAQVKTYFASVRSQFSLPTVWMAVIPFFFFGAVHRRTRLWFVTLLSAFFFVSVMLIIFLNPTLDVHTLFIQRRFLILSHAAYAIWLGYSVIFILSELEIRLSHFAAFQKLKYAGLALAFVLPVTVLLRNYYHTDQIAILGGAEQRGHDFGWQFGHWQLRGVHGIRDDLMRIYGPDEFERVWSEYPNPDYPPELLPDAILFGGTDPGRFVPTYFIFSAHCRPDIYLITQNALADNTYMSFLRDFYGNDIWIPAMHDLNVAFQTYVQSVQQGRVPGGAQVAVRDGRVEVQGIEGVMMVNAILTRQIFDHNKYKHPFYVEESYPIDWMYPYLEPHGLILRMHPKPIEISEERIRDDMAFWAWYTERLTQNPRFQRDIVAQKTFAKLRAAIAGVYAFRDRAAEAETAFQQAIKLHPLNAEAYYRLAEFYFGQGRMEESGRVIESYLEADPHNMRMWEALTQINELHRMDLRRRELESQFNKSSTDPAIALELAELYMNMQLHDALASLAGLLLDENVLPPDSYLRLAQLLSHAKEWDLLERSFQQYLRHQPRHPGVWVDLAAFYVFQQRPREALHALRRAVEVGGPSIQDAIRQDQRFQAIQHMREFQALVPPTSQPAPMMRSLPFH